MKISSVHIISLVLVSFLLFLGFYFLFKSETLDCCSDADLQDYSPPPSASGMADPVHRDALHFDDLSEIKKDNDDESVFSELYGSDISSITEPDFSDNSAFLDSDLSFANNFNPPPAY